MNGLPDGLDCGRLRQHVEWLYVRSRHLPRNPTLSTIRRPPAGWWRCPPREHRPPRLWGPPRWRWRADFGVAGAITLSRSPRQGSYRDRTAHWRGEFEPKSRRRRRCPALSGPDELIGTGFLPLSTGRRADTGHFDPAISRHGFKVGHR